MAEVPDCMQQAAFVSLKRSKCTIAQKVDAQTVEQHSWL